MTELFFEETYSPLSSSEIVAKEQSNLSSERFAHCVRVSQTAKKLAQINHYNEGKASLAGFVHDYAKEIPVDQYKKVIKQENFAQDLLNWNRAIWHGIVGTYFIRRDLKITDHEILTAVNRHTTGDVEMTMLDKIVFMADFIEPGRSFPQVEEAREITYQNLDQGVAYQLNHSLNFLLKQKSKIYPRTVLAYNVWGVNND